MYTKPANSFSLLEISFGFGLHCTGEHVEYEDEEAKPKMENMNYNEDEEDMDEEYLEQEEGGRGKEI